MRGMESLLELDSFRTLDERFGAPKGAAFKTFKALLGELAEGEDFVYLSPPRDRHLIERLRRHGRIYRSSVAVVLLRPSGAARIASVLALGAYRATRNPKTARE